MSNRPKSILFAVLLAFIPGWAEAQAADWVATRLRGPVFVLEASDWVRLERGGAVETGQFLYTARNARVVLEADGDQISVGGSTQVMVIDPTPNGMTTLYQDRGTVTVDVEAQSQPHFTVRTRHLAAVVKGTRFVVTASRTGSSVSVRHGLVEVQDLARNTHADVGAGQTAAVGAGAGEGLAIEGEGEIAPVLPLVGGLVEETDDILHEVPLIGGLLEGLGLGGGGGSSGDDGGDGDGDDDGGLVGGLFGGLL